MVLDLLHDGLTRLDPDGVPEAALAASWRSNQSLTAWRFELDPDATFASGAPVTAERRRRLARAGGHGGRHLARRPAPGDDHRLPGLRRRHGRAPRRPDRPRARRRPHRRRHTAVGPAHDPGQPRLRRGRRSLPGVGHRRRGRPGGARPVGRVGGGRSRGGLRAPRSPPGHRRAPRRRRAAHLRRRRRRLRRLRRRRRGLGSRAAERFGDAVDAYGDDDFVPFHAELFFGLNLQSPALGNSFLRKAIAVAIDRDAIVEAVYCRPGRPPDRRRACGRARPRPRPLRRLRATTPIWPSRSWPQAFPDGQIPPVRIDFDESPAQEAMARLVADDLQAVGIRSRAAAAAPRGLQALRGVRRPGAVQLRVDRRLRLARRLPGAPVHSRRPATT